MTPQVDAVRGDAGYEQALLDITSVVEQRRVVFLSGAGISRPAGLPLSDKLKRVLISAMISGVERAGLRAPTADIDHVLCSQPLERLLAMLAHCHGDHAVFQFLSVLDHASPTRTHDAVAQLCKAGHIGAIVTLNFDVLHELSLRKHLVPFWCQLPLASVRLSEASDGRIEVLKPHGSLPLSGYPYSAGYLAATLDQVGDHPQPETAAAIARIAERNDVIMIAGYRGHDWDIVPLLARTPWSHIIWIQHPDSSGARQELSVTINEWFASTASETTIWVIHDDIRVVLERLLGNLKITPPETNADNEAQWLMLPDERQPSAWPFVAGVGQSALAAILLLDGVRNRAHRRLLPAMERLPAIRNQPVARLVWSRAMAWYRIAHKSQPLRGLRHRLQVGHRLILLSADPRLGRMSADFDVYHTCLRVLEHPVLAPAWLYAGTQALRYRRFLEREAARIACDPAAEAWARKAADDHLGLVRWYFVDLCHTWGYVLLPFANPICRWLSRRWFHRIARRYVTVARHHSHLSHGYYYLRFVEAVLLADADRAIERARKRIQTRVQALQLSGQAGHSPYSALIGAWLEGKDDAFQAAAKSMRDDSGAAVPAGRLRSRLLQRFRFPTAYSILAFSRDVISDLQFDQRIRSWIRPGVRQASHTSRTTDTPTAGEKRAELDEG